MCILFTYVNNLATATRAGCHGYQVILANNRDEFYIRSTLPAARWQHRTECISGLDNEPGREGGTWLGISDRGKIGVLLNILQSHLPDKDKKGRGQLVTDYLTCTEPPEEYTASLSQDRHIYNPFHLLLLHRKSQKWNVHYFGSRDDSSPCDLHTNSGSGPGITGWGNSHRNAPWKKVCYGQAAFSEIVQEYNTTDQRDTIVEKLLALLDDDKEHFPDPVLQSVAKGYLPDVVTQQRSALHNTSPSVQYGTRTKTLVLIDSSGQGEYIERTLREPIDINNPVWETRTIAFSVNDNANKL